jgi:hypothetical protein
LQVITVKAYSIPVPLPSLIVVDRNDSWRRNTSDAARNLLSALSRHAVAVQPRNRKVFLRLTTADDWFRSRPEALDCLPSVVALGIVEKSTTDRCQQQML